MKWDTWRIVANPKKLASSAMSRVRALPDRLTLILVHRFNLLLKSCRVLAISERGQLLAVVSFIISDLRLFHQFIAFRTKVENEWLIPVLSQVQNALRESRTKKRQRIVLETMSSEDIVSRKIRRLFCTRLSQSNLYLARDRRIYNFVSACSASIPCWIRLRLIFGETSLAFAVGSIVVAISSDGPDRSRIRASLCGDVSVLRSTCFLYEYVNGWTKSSQFLWSSAT